MATTPTFTGVTSVAIPVTDQDRTTEVFVQLGFEVRFDAELSEGFRWVDLAPAGGGTGIAIIATGPELPTGIDTGIRLLTSDARAAHEHVQRLGLDAGELLDWETAPLMFSFLDPDGNRYYVAEPG